jgi:hypothetical protein
MRPLLARFSIRASFEAPEDRHAILMLLRAVADAALPILGGGGVRGGVWR